MRDITLMLSSHGWEKLLEEDELAAIERPVEKVQYSNSRHHLNANLALVLSAFGCCIPLL